MKKHRQKAHLILVKTKNYERCYTCDLDVNSYVELMNHRKELHPSNKKCRNLDDGSCKFGNRCWYVHEKEIMDTGEAKEPEPGKFECYICGDVSKNRNELKKHRKVTHPTEVKICKRNSLPERVQGIVTSVGTSMFAKTIIVLNMSRVVII